MSRSRCPLVVSLLTLFAVASVASAEHTATRIPVTTTPQLPGGVSHVVRHLDGSVVCCTDDGVFLSADDLRRWTPVRALSRVGRDFRPVGGDRARFFVEDLAAGEKPRPTKGFPGVSVVVYGASYSLNAVNADGNVTVLRENVQNGICAFASMNVGVIAWKGDSRGTTSLLGAPDNPFGTKASNHFDITLDGGKTWKPIPPPVGGIIQLLWVTTNRLLIVSDNGSMQLFEHKGDGVLRRLWSVDVRGVGDKMARDGEHIWVGHGPIRRFSVADGHFDVTINVDGFIEGTAACHQSLLVYGREGSFQGIRHGLDDFKTMAEADAAFRKKLATSQARHLEVWVRDSEGEYVRRSRIPVPPIGVILPLTAPLCLVIATDGTAMHLDLSNDKLAPVALQVTPMPPVPTPPADPNAATDKEMKEMDTLAVRVPQADRFAIFEAVVKIPGLMQKQQVELATKRFRAYLEQHKPKPEEGKEPAGRTDTQ